MSPAKSAGPLLQRHSLNYVANDANLNSDSNGFLDNDTESIDM